LAHRYILLTDKAHLNHDGIYNTHNSHVWSDENPHATVENNIQLFIIANVWRGVLDDQLIGPFIFEGRLTEKA
jgi:hypothetical protein